jgi:periplasmic divalent cation tolerance protein
VSGALVVLCTAPDREVADRLANDLVELRLAACVNLIGGVRSIYRWEGEVARDDEILLVIKTTEARFGDLGRAIAARHPYQVPEVLALSVADGHAPYLDWILKGVAARD